MLIGLPSLSPDPLRVVLLNDRLHCYGPDLRARLRFPSLAALAAAAPLGSVSLVELGDTALFDAVSVSADHPLRDIRHEAQTSIWIGLPGLLRLIPSSPHPLAQSFRAWIDRQRGYHSLFTVPLGLLDQGLDLLEQALGPAAQVLAVIHEPGPGGTELSGQVVDPPDVYGLADLVGSCLEDEVFLREQTRA